MRHPSSSNDIRVIIALPFIAIALTLASCGGGKRPETVVLNGSDANDAGVKATATSMKERDKTLYINVTLQNTGKQTVLFKNPESLRVGGFKVAADGREAIGADAGKMQATKARAARLRELAPGAEAELDLKYTFEPALAHNTYPWTLTITNMFIDDKKIPDLTLSYAPDTTK